MELCEANIRNILFNQRSSQPPEMDVLQRQGYRDIQADMATL